MHVAKREEVVDIILQGYRRQRCFLLEGGAIMMLVTRFAAARETVRKVACGAS